MKTNLYITTQDNIRIAINYLKNGFDNIIILIPGWFMTKDSKAFLEMADEFGKHCDVITIDCRGHGKSTGFYTFTSKELNDIRAVVNFIKNKHYKNIYLAGFSLGGALAVLHGALNQDIDKIIAVSAPADFIKIENQMWHPNAWIPTLKKFELKRWLSIRPSLMIHRKIKPQDVVSKIKVPTLFIAGEEDVTVKPWHTELLYKKAQCEKKYILMSGKIHAEDIFLADKKYFIDVCINFLNS